ncbi:hypothetical protein GQR58_023376 [Nymphon striatum]|nr:hypothetical protein GQR58_023376 [Nymphon striatum]
MRRFEGGEWSYTEFYRHTGYISTNEDALVEIAVKRLVTALEDFIENGSGWELACISFIDVTLNNFNILMRRQVIGHGDVIDLPKALKNKHAVYNLENTNGKCFLYSLLCVLKHASVKAKHDARSYNQFLDIFDVSGIDFPFNLGSFNRFHVLNKKYAINIFEYLKDEVKILRRPSLRQYDGRTIKAEMTYVKMWYECNSIKLHGLNKEERKKLITDSPYCYMCKKNVNLTNGVVDHCHLTDEVIMKKGTFCYEYLNSENKLSEKQLPTRDMFYNRLINEECSHANYDIAKKAWFQFDCDSLKDYLMGYLRMDVYQLADIFINYTNMCKNYYGLYPVNYVSLPGLSLDATLKSSNIMLDLITDSQMLLDFKTSIRGGLVFLNKHHSIANIPKTEGYDPKSPQKQIIVVDENNLYGFSMQNYLPKGNFKYINEFDFNNVDEKYGYFFVVDLAYPSKIHDLTCDFPLASEHMKITDDMLSDYMKNLPIKKGAPTQKLTLNQFDKIEYKVFYPVLKFYLEMGMKITKIHRIIKYDQEPFLKSYIDFNSRMRQNSTTDFGKSFFKLLNNSVFGKLCENLTNRTNFKLCTNETQLAKVLAHPQIKQTYFFDDNLTGHSIDITEVEMNRPLAIGSCILDLKVLNYYLSKVDVNFQNCTTLKRNVLDDDYDGLWLHLVFLILFLIGVAYAVYFHKFLKRNEKLIDL